MSLRPLDRFFAKDLTVSYSESNVGMVVEHFTHQFHGGRVYVIMGPNGCGKSTLLRLLVGEMTPDSGLVEFVGGNGERSLSLEYLPQDYRQALFPWRTVLWNVIPWGDQGLAAPSPPSSDLDDIVRRTLLKFGLNGSLSESYPYQLSGGQEQIVLLARCVLSESRVVILDEPFSALDVIRRATIADQLRSVWVGSGRTVICAMHEPDEVVTLADEVLIFQGPPMRLANTVRRTGDGRDDERLAFRERLIRSLESIYRKDGSHVDQG